MDYARSFAISAAGMAVERTRVDVAALNLANANTVQGAGGPSFQPLRVVALPGALTTAAPAGSFAGQVEQVLDAGGLGAVSLPEVAIEPSAEGPRRVYEPGHPFADEKGYVAYPGVNAATEMMGLMSALRAYESNVVAMNTARSMALKALDIGGGQ